jgi:hypothetical protein
MTSMHLARMSERSATLIPCLAMVSLVSIMAYSDIAPMTLYDAWWHMAAADEYMRTGVFAKDPFYPNVQPFAPFGLMDWATAQLGTLMGISIERAFCILLSASILLFTLCCFRAGSLIAGDLVGGYIFSGFALAQLETVPLPNIGLPCMTATAVLWAYATSLFGRTRRIEGGEGASDRHPPPATPIDGYRDAGAVGAAWRGMMLGLIFDLHVFVGLVAVAVTGSVALVDLVYACRIRGAIGRSVRKIF